MAAALAEQRQRAERAEAQVATLQVGLGGDGCDRSSGGCPVGVGEGVEG